MRHCFCYVPEGQIRLLRSIALFFWHTNHWHVDQAKCPAKAFETRHASPESRTRSGWGGGSGLEADGTLALLSFFFFGICDGKKSEEKDLSFPFYSFRIFSFFFVSLFSFRPFSNKKR